MMEENRQSVRYHEIGRVVCNDLCALPGILDDISADGCKIHFPLSFVVDIEKEYMLRIIFSRSPEAPLQLMVRPRWVRESSGSTQIGMEILYSPDQNRLKEFIAYLEEISIDEEPDIV
ncbi:MAG: PilZ domain-containing protein [Treponema sp.]|nr:PilZ domain-containing protein [Treponema sp.]